MPGLWWAGMDRIASCCLHRHPLLSRLPGTGAMRCLQWDGTPMSETDAKVAAALRTVEEACPCALETKCGCGIEDACCRCANPSGKAFHVLSSQDEKHGGRVADCLWPGHAAIARLREAAEKAVRAAVWREIVATYDHLTWEVDAESRMGRQMLREVIIDRKDPCAGKACGPHEEEP